MLLTLNNSNIDINNILLCEPINNTVMDNSKFIRLIYSDKNIIMNGIYIKISMHINNVENAYNKLRCFIEPEKNKEIYKVLSYIENIILSKYVTNKISSYKLTECLNKGIINYINKKEKDTNKNFSILVLGGSQGAEIFGKIIPPVITKLKNEGYDLEINQQCTSYQKDEIEKYYLKNKIKNYVFEFEKDISKLVFSSNLAITRCGASSTAELVHSATPFIAVPLPNSIDDHQFLNAKYYEDKGCCFLLEQKNFNVKNLFNLIEKYIKDQKKLDIIRQNMKKNYNKNVYADIENQLEEFIL